MKEKLEAVVNKFNFQNKVFDDKRTIDIVYGNTFIWYSRATKLCNIGGGFPIEELVTVVAFLKEYLEVEETDGNL